MKQDKSLLLESYRTTKKLTGHNPGNPYGFKNILANDNKFDVYVRSLSEGLNAKMSKDFKMLAQNTREKLLENSTFQLNPYETLTLPVLRIFYPRLIARELVTVAPIDKPDVVKSFLIPLFNTYGNTTPQQGPVYTDVSMQPSVPISQGAVANVPGTTNILQTLNLTNQQAHIQKDFTIYQVADGSGNLQQVNIQPTVDGTIASSTSINGVSDTLLGTVDFYNGTVELTSANGSIAKAYYTVSISLEQNVINPTVTLDIQKIRMPVEDRQITAQWSIQFEQDVRALYDLDVQAELVSVIGQQIQLDIDRQIVNDLIATTSSALVPASHRMQFTKTPPPSFTWGPKMWNENILPIFSQLSAQIYTDTNIKAANMIAANPVDAAILESIEEYSYVGTGSDGGDLGYREATIAGGRWKVITSPVVPQGQMILTYKPDVEMQSVYYYSPYQPAVLTPYPMAPTPAMTVLSRYAHKMIRPLGVGLVSIQ